MKSKLNSVLRILLSLIFIPIGLNKFFSFIPLPPMNEAGSGFIEALIKTGYMWPLVGITEITAGVLLLANKWKGLALIFGAIISVNIVLFRILLDTNGIALALFVAVLNIVLMYLNKESYDSIFKS
jgi:putative oxidoreductase